MDRGELKNVVITLFEKYRWIIVVLIVGIFLMVLPEETTQMEVQSTHTNTSDPEPSFQQQLEETLSKLEGAGKVKVLLSVASGSETHYQTDEDNQRTDNHMDHQVKTVIITTQDRAEMGLVRRIDPPVYLGAIVLCQGADKPSVKLAVVDAVGTATGLSTDKISVLKMK